MIRFVDVDPMLTRRPRQVSPWPAPSPDHRAGLIKDDDGGRGHAALKIGRRFNCSGVSYVQAETAMDDPDVVARVNCYAGNLTEYPVIGQRLRPMGVDLEYRSAARVRTVRGFTG